MNLNESTLQCEIILSDSRGIYIPQNFAEIFDMDQWNISKEDEEILISGPDHEWYWETWDTILNNAEYIDDDGVKWQLFQDGDVFAVVWDEDYDENE